MANHVRIAMIENRVGEIIIGGDLPRDRQIEFPIGCFTADSMSSAGFPVKFHEGHKSLSNRLPFLNINRFVSVQSALIEFRVSGIEKVIGVAIDRDRFRLCGNWKCPVIGSQISMGYLSARKK